MSSVLLAELGRRLNARARRRERSGLAPAPAERAPPGTTPARRDPIRGVPAPPSRPPAAAILAHAGPAGPRPRRPPLPALWLFTDPARLPDPLAAAARLPRGAGIVLRRYAPAEAARLAVLLAALARRRGLTLMISTEARLALRLGAGLHLPEAGLRQPPLPFLLARRAIPAPRRPPLTAASHGRTSLARAAALGADFAFLSPVFATASHPGAPWLGPVRFGLMLRGHRRPARIVALGGIDAATARRLAGLPLAGLAAIGALADPAD